MNPSQKDKDPKIGPEEEEILSFITQQGKTRWTDLTNEFEKTKRKWHHSKFVKHWKNVKSYLEKIPNEKTGRDEYKIKDESQSMGDKALLRVQTRSGDLNNVEISAEKLAKAAELIIKNSSFELWKAASERSARGLKTAEEKLAKQSNGRETVLEPDEVIYSAIEKSADKMKSDLEAEKRKQGILGKIKLTKSPPGKPDFRAFADFYKIIYPIAYAHKLEEDNLRTELNRIFRKIKIQVLTYPGESVPLLTEDDVVKLVEIVLPKFIDENKGKPRENQFKIIVSFPT